MAGNQSMDVTHFSSAEEFRLWLEKNHAVVTELQIGFYKKSAGRTGMTYKEAVDEALCFGWIDGVVRKIDEDSFTHRFTPRKTTSIWSNINVGRVARLTAAGKMHSAGLRAFEAKKAGKVGIYSFEQKKLPQLSPAYLKKFKANRKAWVFFGEQAPWYQRKIIHNIVTGKQEATRLRRLDRAIAASADGVII
jgi:uncharacterized protein YdeI (YjbR/CyaY-like superfamily)